MDGREPNLMKTAVAATFMAALVCAAPATAETYRGVTIAPEHRCTPYHSSDYPYPQMSRTAPDVRVGLLTHDPAIFDKKRR